MNPAHGEAAPPDRPNPNRFTLLDGMILVAAVALGLVGVQAYSRIYVTTWKPGERATIWVRFGAPTACLLFSGPLAVIVAAACRPRHEGCRRFGGPGVIACFAILLELLLIAFVGSLIAFVGPLLSREFDINDDNEFWTYMGAINLSGPLVLAAWLALALVGQWRPERTWIDRAGRFLGVLSIVFYLIYWIEY